VRAARWLIALSAVAGFLGVLGVVWTAGRDDPPQNEQATTPSATTGQDEDEQDEDAVAEDDDFFGQADLAPAPRDGGSSAPSARTGAS
jgi:hypothetical protein